jgi:AcrR family transcriptional regulator
MDGNVGIAEGTKRRGRPSSRDRILEAAAQLVGEVGAANLTYDALAERTGISKGGLLYNFPNKGALLRAMVEGYKEEFIEAWRANTDAAPEGPERVLRALIETHLQRAPRFESECASGVGVLAALAENPGMLESVRTFNQRVADRLASESPDPDRALILWLAIEGLVLQQLLQVSAIDGPTRRRLLDKMMTLVREETAAAA